MNSSAKTILGVLAAGAAGVAVGMLLAPDKGEKLRGSLKDTLHDIGDKIYSFIGEQRDNAADLIKDVKEQAKGVKEDVQERAENIKGAAKDAAKDALS